VLFHQIQSVTFRGRPSTFQPLPPFESKCSRTMEYITSVPSQWMLGLGAIFLLWSLLALTRWQRVSVLDRFRFPRRRASGASTPPRSISPDASEKKSGPLGLDFVETFPPSLRSTIPQLAKLASANNKKILLSSNPSPESLAKDALPMNVSYMETRSTKYTPTGFSTDEIKALGDFPAYDILTGVPNPAPYKAFNHLTALARPYRPLRWNYHQTMCWCTSSSPLNPY
jgi:hypothetical protein